MKENLLELHTIQSLLQDRRLYLVAEKCGLSYPTVKRVADGGTDVSLGTWKKLSAYFTEAQSGNDPQ